MQIYGWELLAAFHKHDKNTDHSHCEGEDLMCLICHNPSCDHMCKELCDVLGRDPSK